MKDLPSYSRAALFTLALMPLNELGHYDVDAWRVLWHGVRDAFPRYHRAFFITGARRAQAGHKPSETTT